MAFITYKYLDNSILNGFDNYKYSAVDTSPLSRYVMHPFWDWIVKFYPRWLAPNVLTFGGFLLQVLATLLVAYYDPVMLAEIPNELAHPSVPIWVWLVAGLCIFVAHQLDGTDGKQARRTGSGGPLGELFDHGLDSWATFFMPISIMSIFGRSEPASVSVFRLYIAMVSITFVFILSHWEKYNTGILFLPWSYDVSQVGMVLAYMLTFCVGSTAFWHQFIPGTNLYVIHILEFILDFSAYGCSLFVSLWNVIAAYRAGTNCQKNFYEAMRPLFAPFFLYASMSYWILNSPNSLCETNPRLVYYLSGVLFANICTRLIINQMSKTRCDVHNWLLVPLIFPLLYIFAAQIHVVDPVSSSVEMRFLWCYSFVATLFHVHYGCCVGYQLADHFNIRVFSLQPVAVDINGVASKKALDNTNNSNNVKSQMRTRSKRD